MLHINWIFLITIGIYFSVWAFIIFAFLIGHYIWYKSKLAKICNLEDFKNKEEMKNFKKKYLIWMTLKAFNPYGKYNFFAFLILFTLLFSFFISDLLIQEKNMKIFLIIWPILSFSFIPFWIVFKLIIKHEKKNYHYRKKITIYNQETYKKCKKKLKESLQDLKEIDKTKHLTFFKDQEKEITKLQDAIDLYIRFIEFDFSKSKKTKKD